MYKRDKRDVLSPCNTGYSRATRPVHHTLPLQVYEKVVRHQEVRAQDPVLDLCHHKIPLELAARGHGQLNLPGAECRNRGAVRGQEVVRHSRLFSALYRSGGKNTDCRP